MAFTLTDYTNWVELGRGAFGEVYRARQKSLNRFVCIKRSKAKSVLADTHRRMQDEATAMAQLHHHNLVAVHDYGSQSQWDYIIMEYVDGLSLDRLQGLDRSARLLALADACLGTAAIHKRGWVHRDLKPDNILISSQGDAKVADFGMLFRLDKLAQTASHAILGTALYMSPEQVLGKALSPASDVFSFGSMLYEVLGGRSPFGQETVPATLHAIAYTTCDMDPVPPEARELVSKCLQKNPQERQMGCEQLRQEILKLERVADPQTRDRLAAASTKGFGEHLVGCLLKEAEASEMQQDRRQAYFHLVEAHRISGREDIGRRVQSYGSLDERLGLKSRAKTKVNFISIGLLVLGLIVVLSLRGSLRRKDLGENLLKEEKGRITYLGNRVTWDSVPDPSGTVTRGQSADAAIWLVHPGEGDRIFYVDGKPAVPSGDSIRIEPGFHHTVVKQGNDTLHNHQGEWRPFEVRQMKGAQ